MSDSIYRALRGLSRRENISSKRNYLETTQGKLYLLWIGCAVLSVILILFWKLSNFEIIKILSLSSLVVSYSGFMCHPFVEFFFHRKEIGYFLKNPLSTIYGNAKHIHNIDSKYISFFLSKKRCDLELVKLEVLAEKNAFEKRTSILVGAIEKIGVVPGIFALLISFDKIKSTEFDWILALAYSMPFLYIIGAYSHILVSRMTRHISLIDHVLNKET